MSSFIHAIIFLKLSIFLFLYFTWLFDFYFSYGNCLTFHKSRTYTIFLRLLPSYWQLVLTSSPMISKITHMFITINTLTTCIISHCHMSNLFPRSLSLSLRLTHSYPIRLHFLQPLHQTLTCFTNRLFILILLHLWLLLWHSLASGFVDFTSSILCAILLFLSLP